MGDNIPKATTRLREYLTILRQQDQAGRPFIIVGGHAVNFWAELYFERERRLEAFLPFTSKDLDLIGTRADAAQLATRIGWQMLNPTPPAGLVEAVLSSRPGGEGLTVEFLPHIKGVSRESIVAHAREGTIRIPEIGEIVQIRVLDPVLLLAGKIRNVVEIDQDTPGSPRQDLRHVKILALCVPCFLDDVRTRTPPHEQQGLCAKYVAMLAALKNTYSGRVFESRHRDAIKWAHLIPETIRGMPFDAALRECLGTLGV